MSFNLQSLGDALQLTFERSHVQASMGKCTTACVASYEEKGLLPSEDRCLQNCFAKSQDFLEFADEQIKHYVNNS